MPFYPILYRWLVLIYLCSGAKLLVNQSWKNPSQEWHVGYKLVYELFTDTLTSRIQVVFSGLISTFSVLKQACIIVLMLTVGLIKYYSEGKEEKVG